MPGSENAVDSRSRSGNITWLLQRWSAGDAGAFDEIAVQLYDELHRLACSYLRSERPDHTLQATAVVNEAFLRLLERGQVQWNNRAHFVGVAAHMMRHILVDHGRHLRCVKRGGRDVRVTLAEATQLGDSQPPDVKALDEGLSALAEIDPQKARIVELRFFGGLTIEECAAVTGLSESTVVREWRRARAWLYGELKEKLCDGR